MIQNKLKMLVIGASLIATASATAIAAEKPNIYPSHFKMQGKTFESCH